MRRLSFILVLGACLIVDGCQQKPKTDYRGLDNAGMWSSSLDELKKLKASDAEIAQLTKLKQAGASDDLCLSLLKAANTIASPLVVGVRDRWGRLHPGRETAVSGSSHNFQVDVPYGTPLNVWLHSWRFLLADSTGGPIDHWGAQFPFQVGASSTAPSFVFNISGEVNP